MRYIWCLCVSPVIIVLTIPQLTVRYIQRTCVSPVESITVKNIDEYKGIVAGLIDKIGIVELINQKLGVDNREKITAG